MILWQRSAWGLLGSLLCCGVLAQEESAATPGLGVVGGFGEALWRLLGAISVVAIALVAVWWFGRRLRGFSQPRAGAIQLIDTLALGTRERLSLIEVGGERFLLGSAPNRVGPLVRVAASTSTDTLTHTSTNFDQALSDARMPPAQPNEEQN